MRRVALLIAIVAAQACATAAEAPPTAEAPPAATPGIGYPSVEAAFRALKADPHAVVTVEGDWMLFTQRQGSATTSWHFTRPGHPAHPSVLRRRVDESSGTIEKSTLCQSHLPSACAELSRGQSR